MLEINQTCAVQTGCFPGDPPLFPVTLSASAGGTSFRLTSDLILPDVNATGIEISTSDIDVDLGGFSIISVACVGATSNCTPTGGIGHGVVVSIPTNIHGISIRNGHITGMGGHGVSLGRQSEVRNVRARWNRLDGIRVDRGSIVSENTAFENGDRGIFASEASIVARNSSTGNSIGIVAVTSSILENTVSLNSGFGINVFFESSHISGNTLNSNAGVGIVTGPGSIVTRNSVRGSTGSGILIRAGSRVEGNTVADNTGVGINVNSGPSTISNNTVITNGGTGIDCSDGGQSDVRGNSVIGNTGVGIDLVDPARPDAIYRDNVIYDNVGGTVNGSTNLNRGGNTCRNFGAFSDCP